MPHANTAKWIHFMNDRTTDVIAAAAVTSTLWFPGLEALSHGMAVWTPIAGGVWLFVQIVFKVGFAWREYHEGFRKRRKEQRRHGRPHLARESEEPHRTSGDSRTEK